MNAKAWSTLLAGNVAASGHQKQAGSGTSIFRLIPIQATPKAARRQSSNQGNARLDVSSWSTGPFDRRFA